MAPGSFRLQGSSSDFAFKLDSVFGSLGAIERQHDDWTKSDAKKGQPSPQKEEPAPLQDSEFSIPRSRTQLDRRGQRSLAGRSYERAPRIDLSKEGLSHHQTESGSQFRRPRGLPPPRRPTKVPDHRVHPERWTKYSLDSVSDRDISDKGNTAAAINFFKEQDFTKKADNKARRISVEASTYGTSSSVARRHVMPEHVVGWSNSSGARKNKITGLRTGIADRVRLSFLNHLDSSDEKSLPTDAEDENFVVSLDRRADDNKSMDVDDTVKSAASNVTAASNSTTLLSLSATESKNAEAQARSSSESDGVCDRQDVIDSELKDAISAPPMMKRRKCRGNVRTRTTELDDDN
ncbi:hypothetical protein BIW11_11907 [Tropilaelaps mercedesae]|uniref:U5 small nuclear ribonucleoprotein TSSC4 n=1 Tax=Tropilaelaps mercedesae TaxID=418985 RepID=A0A1V9X9B5_9ACAR|nr:hypothetical protein BIW11_11907 [Tropilaelaps mercedesae]